MSRYEENDRLLERLIKFAEDIIILCKNLPKNLINTRLIPQLIDCSTSIGANYSEACEAESAKDFIHKVKIVIKEIKETRFFLRLVLKSNIEYRDEITLRGKETVEFLKIFSKIASKFKK